MSRIVWIYLLISTSIIATTYELKKNQLNILKFEKERYIRQKKINFSRFEKLQMEEEIIQKQLEISEFIQEKLEEIKKYEVRIEELESLLDLGKTKHKEMSKNYKSFKENKNGISNFELLSLESELNINRFEMEKWESELSYLNYLLTTNEYKYISDEIKTEKIIEIKIKALDSLIDIRKQEIKIIEMEKKGLSLLELKKKELENIELEKAITIYNDGIRMREIESDLVSLRKDRDISKERQALMLKEINMLEERFKLGAFSKKELFEKKNKNYKLLEEIIGIEGEIKLKEIELNQ